MPRQPKTMISVRLTDEQIAKMDQAGDVQFRGDRSAAIRAAIDAYVIDPHRAIRGQDSLLGLELPDPEPISGSVPDDIRQRAEQAAAAAEARRIATCPHGRTHAFPESVLCIDCGLSRPPEGDWPILRTL